MKVRLLLGVLRTPGFAARCYFQRRLHLICNSYIDPRRNQPEFMALRQQMGYSD